MATTFPSSRTISPSVRIVERDFSAYGYGPSLNKTAMVGFAAKGPMNTPTVIRSVEELFRTFGYPNPNLPSYLIYGAIDYLREGSELTVVRVGEDDAGDADFAKTAYVDVPSAGAHAQIVTGATQGTWGGGSAPIALTGAHYIRIRANGQAFIRELSIPAGNYGGLVSTASATYTNTLLSVLAAQITEDDGFTVTSCGTGSSARLVFKSRINGANSSVEIVSARKNLYYYDSSPTGGQAVSTTYASDTSPNVTLGIGRKMTSPSITGTATGYSNSVAGTYNFGAHRNLRLEVQVWGTGDADVDGVVQTITLPHDASGNNLDSISIASLVSWMNGGAGGLSVENSPQGFRFVVSSNSVKLVAAYEPATGEYQYLTGTEAKILVRPTSTADDILGLTNIVQVGTNGQAAVTVNVPNDCSPSAAQLDAGKINGSTTGGSGTTFRIFASTPGEEGNLTNVVVSVDPDNAKISLAVNHRNKNVETWTELHKTEAHATDSEHYIEKINPYSDYIRIEDDTLSEELPAPGTYTLGSLTLTDANAGTNGIPTDPTSQANLIIGSSLVSSGLQSLSEPERIDVDVVAVPGVSTTSVVNALKTLCEVDRQDCMFIVDPPFGLTPLQVKKWHNGQHPLNTTKFNSNYGAMYWPWIKEYDAINKVDVWVPPSGSATAVFARTDAIVFPWFPPAGLRRGRIPWATATETVPYLSDRDSLYGYDNTVNVITNFPGDGIVIWGQKTLQRYTSALDRINVRRLMLYAEKTIRARARFLLFEPHDELLQDEFRRMASSVLDNIVANRGMDAYIVECDDQLNTQAVKDRNELRARIGIQPTKSAEFVYIEFTIHRTGTFEQSVLQGTGIPTGGGFGF